MVNEMARLFVDLNFAESVCPKSTPLFCLLISRIALGHQACINT